MHLSGFQEGALRSTGGPWLGEPLLANTKEHYPLKLIQLVLSPISGLLSRTGDYLTGAMLEDGQIGAKLKRRKLEGGLKQVRPAALEHQNQKIETEVAHFCNSGMQPFSKESCSW